MSSTYSPTLRIELIGDGDQSGIWGQTTNNNLGTLLEQAITGVVTITMTDTNYTLTNYNGVSDEARNAVIVATGTNSAQRDIIAPLVEKVYTIKNSTTGGYAVRIIGVSGTGVTVPNGVTTSVYCDGTNFYNLQVGTTGNEIINGNLTVTGTTTLQGAMTGTTGVFSGAISSVSPAFTGTPTVPTASNGTNSTQAASTAFVQNTITALTLGTMSTQNANSVAITGGTISGVTVSSATISSLNSALAVAYGGTGTTSSTGSGSVVLSASPALTGVPTAPTATAGTNTTQIATTAFVTNVTATLGTMSTQNANNVAITGGTIAGVALSSTVSWACLPAGTVVAFAQASAPTGWTQITSDSANNRMLRVVNSTGAGTGGSASPILMDVVPSHTHTYSGTSTGQSADHTHSGTTSTESANHSHGVSGYTGGQTADHSHNLNVNGETGLQGGSGNDLTAPYGGGSPLGLYSNGTSNDHAHYFSATSGGVSANHTHTVTTGGVSAGHTHNYSGTTAANASASNWAPRYIDMIICSKN